MPWQQEAVQPCFIARFIDCLPEKARGRNDINAGIKAKNAEGGMANYMTIAEAAESGQYAPASPCLWLKTGYQTLKIRQGPDGPGRHG